MFQFAQRHWRMLAGWWLGCLVGVLCATLTTPTTYTAEVRLAVGSQSLAAQSVPGYVASLPDIASTYSRYLSTTNSSLANVAAGAHVAKTEAKGISATPIPDTAIIRVFGEASTPSSAMKLAMFAVRTLELQLAESTSNLDNAYKDLQTTSAALAEAESRSSIAQQNLSTLTADKASEAKIEQARSEAITASARQQVASARQQAASGRYQSVFVQGSAVDVTTVEGAQVVSQDTGERLQQFAVVGTLIALAGALVTIGLRNVLAWRRRNRALSVATSSARSDVRFH